MLFHLSVRNLALIDSAEVEFEEGLNILTGETGAGKSVIIGSVNAALGGKTSKDMIRQGCDYAYVELVFSVTDEKNGGNWPPERSARTQTEILSYQRKSCLPEASAASTTRR